MTHTTDTVQGMTRRGSADSLDCASSSYALDAEWRCDVRFRAPVFCWCATLLPWTHNPQEGFARGRVVWESWGAMRPDLSCVGGRQRGWSTSANL